jgi:drug/metabolite transporter (DMT)-like permease
MEPTTYNHFLGGLFALSAGACWAVASIFFSVLGRHASSLAMNFGKGVVALICLLGAMLFAGFGSADPRGWLLLSLSGLAGITLGDTTFFHTLARLGPRRTLLLTTLIPVLVAVLSFLFLGERLGVRAWGGAALCVAGVSWTMWERNVRGSGPDRGSWRQGLGYGLITISACAVAVILTKVGLGTVRPLDATFIRLLAGTGGLALLGVTRGEVGGWVKSFNTPRLLGLLLLASVVGTFFGIWMSNLALYYTSATVATVLGATDPLFVLPLAALLLGERVSSRSVLGAAVAVAGVALLLTQ